MTQVLTPQKAAELLKELQYAKVRMGGQLSIRDEYFKQALEQLPRWIACAERMPEVGHEIILFNGTVRSGYYYTEYGDFSDVIEDAFTINNASHWMPLPESPL